VENRDIASNSVNLKSQLLVLAEDTPIASIEAIAATAASKRIRFDSIRPAGLLQFLLTVSGVFNTWILT
jgi:hypothetical protein